MSSIIFYCPVCGANIKYQMKCIGCGYEESRDYEVYPTLSSIPLSLPSVRIKRQELENKRIEERIQQLLYPKIIELMKQAPNGLNGIGNYLAQTIATSPTANTTKKTDNSLQSLLEISDVQVGGLVCFGHYEQGNGVAPIEWRVLEVRNSEILLITEMAIECMVYNGKDISVTWETSSLRRWLNNEFLKIAFTTAERKRLVMSSVIAGENPSYKIDPGNTTQDRVFLLSIKEVEQYFPLEADRNCHPTAYAKKRGAYENSRRYCWWWLRSPGYYGTHAVRVNADGSIRTSGSKVDDNNVCVRPAIWINLDS